MNPELIVGVDRSEEARAALAWAVEEARLRDEPLTAVQVLPAVQVQLAEAGLGADERGRVARTLRVHAERALERIVADTPHEQIVLKQETLVSGGVAGTLIERAEGTGALVVGRRGGGGFARLVLGSVTQQAAAHARCPVVVVPTGWAPPRRGDRRVVVGIDGSEGAAAALAQAAYEARIREAVLEIVVVQDPPAVTPDASVAQPAPPSVMWVGLTPLRTPFTDEERRTQREQSEAVWNARAHRVVDQALVALGPDAVPAHVERTVVADRRAARALLGIAESADLLVVGARGAGGLPALRLGSVSQQCVHHAAGPVMVVRSSHRERPGDR